MVKDKVILITGGTGSFGKAVLNRLIQEDVAEIRIFSRDEKKQEDLRLRLGNEKLKFFIGDVRDISSVNAAMPGVDLVFHAAALKQVPSCEFFPMEAVKTNVIGADNVMEAATNHGVKTCVVLSTDKAVQPVNAMGLSKALMEKNMIARSEMASRRGTVLCATRYGNVMASRGSVIPLFLQQIKSGRPMTVTSANMTRFLMYVNESIDLVFHAFEHAKPGDIFVQKSTACTIGNLAEAVRNIIKPDHPIEYIGMRHGEKDFETLVSREELMRSEDMGRYFRIEADARDLNYSDYFSTGRSELEHLADYSSNNTTLLNVAEIEQVLRKLDVVREAIDA